MPGKPKYRGSRRFASRVEAEFNICLFRSPASKQSAVDTTLQLAGHWRLHSEDVGKQQGYHATHLSRKEAMRNDGTIGRYSSGLSSLPMVPPRATVVPVSKLSLDLATDSETCPLPELHSAYAKVIEDLCIAITTASPDQDYDFEWYGLDQGTRERGIDPRTAKLMGMNVQAANRAGQDSLTKPTRENLHIIGSHLHDQMARTVCAYDVASVESFQRQVNEIPWETSMNTFTKTVGLDANLSLLGQLATAEWHQRAWSKLKVDRTALLDFDLLDALLWDENLCHGDCSVLLSEDRAEEIIEMADQVLDDIQKTVADLRSEADELCNAESDMSAVSSSYLKQTLSNLLIQVQKLTEAKNIDALNAAFLRARMDELKQQKTNRKKKPKPNNSHLSNTNTIKDGKSRVPTTLWGLFGQYAGLTVNADDWMTWQATEADLHPEDWTCVSMKREEFESERERIRTKNRRQRARDKARKRAANPGASLEQLRLDQEKRWEAITSQRTLAEETTRKRQEQKDAEQTRLKEIRELFALQDAASLEELQAIKADRQAYGLSVDDSSLMSKSVWDPESPSSSDQERSEAGSGSLDTASTPASTIFGRPVSRQRIPKTLPKTPLFSSEFLNELRLHDLIDQPQTSTQGLLRRTRSAEQL